VLSTSTFILKPLFLNSLLDPTTNKIKIKVKPEKPQNIAENHQNIYLQYQYVQNKLKKTENIKDLPYILVASKGISLYSKNL
jgi:hypothetical protein